jgi:hypothetical protein
MTIDNRKKLKTWADFAKGYDLVLFNNCINIEEGGVIEDWLEVHTCDKTVAEWHMQDCKIKNCKDCKEYLYEHGNAPQCECEVFQWYAIAVGDRNREYLNETYNMDIFWSDNLQLNILPVYHYGTAWDYVDLKTNCNN